MIPKDVQQITEQDFQALCDNNTPERQSLEYKQELPGNADSDKKEFLLDVSSFANGIGGDLIFGIGQNPNTGMPQKIGLDIQNVDQEIARLENIIRDGIEPRLTGLLIEPYTLSNSRTIILIRIQKSSIGSHRVVYKYYDRFYGRNSNGKYRLDYLELKRAFNGTENLMSRIRQFKEDRLSKVYANQTFIPCKNNAKVVVHLVPCDSFDSKRYDISKISSDSIKLPPMCSNGWNNKHNFDGYLTYYAGMGEVECLAYTELFNNRIIEAVETCILNANSPLIPSIIFEQRVIQYVGRYLSVLQELNAGMPIFLFIALVGVKGYVMGGDMMRTAMHVLMHGISTIDRDVLQLPEVEINSYETNVATILKPCFDALWNACGFPGSQNYNASGEWKPQ